MKTQNSIKRLFAIATLLFAMLATASADWSTYDGSQTFSDYGFSAGSSSSFGGDVNVIADAENAGNSLVELIGPAELKNYWKWQFKDTDSAGIAANGVTVVTRMKAQNDTSKIAGIQITTGALYAKIYVNSGGDVKVDGDQTYSTGLDFSEYHVFRATMVGSELSVWVDDVKYCDAFTVTNTSSNSPSYRVGDASTSDSYSAVIDWIIWDETGAFAPGEGSDYPAGIIISPLVGGEEGAWEIYAADEDPATFGFGEGNSTMAGTSTILADTENAGNNLLDMRSSSPDKWYWKSSNHADGYDPKEGFTVVFRMSGITVDSANVGEMEVGGGGYREKVRVYGNGQLNLEKAGITVDFPEGVDVMDFNVYRVTFTQKIDGTDTTGFTQVWLNDVFLAEGTTTTTSGNSRYQIGDSNSGKSYAALIDWIIRDVTGAYSPYDSPDYPDGLVLSPLAGGPIEVPDMLRFDDMSLEVAQAGGTIEAGLEANVAWTLEWEEAWITNVTPLAGDSGVATFEITAQENTGAAPRSATIYGMIGEDEMDELTITQDGQAVMIEALSAVASSAQLKDGILRDAPFAIDGYDSTAWVPVDAVVNGNFEWIKVAVAPGSEVVLVKMQEYKGHERAVVFSIDYWNGSAYVESAPQQILPAPGVANTEVAFALPAPITTDTVMFKIYGCVTGDKTASEASGWFTMSEVSVWGGEASSLRDYAAIEYSVYPNPTEGSFTIENASGANVRLVSLSGQVMLEKSNISASENIDLNLNTGIYLLSVDGAVSKVVIK